MDAASALPHSLILRVILVYEILDTVLGQDQLPSGAFPDLLPRVWAWFKFLDTYCDSHSDIKSHSFDVYTFFVRIMYRLRRKGTATHIFNNTPGLRSLVIRAWAMFLDTDDFLGNPTFFQLSQMMMDLEAHAPINFQEILVGARGGVFELATLVSRHISAYGGQTRHTQFVCLIGALEVLRDTEDNSACCAALLEQGIVTALTGLIYKLSTRSDAKELLVGLFLALTNKLNVVPGYRWIAESLRAGLLKSIVLCAKHHPSSVPESLDVLLTETLPRAMVYYSVLVHVEKTLPETRSLASSFDASGVLRHWQSFALMADDRLRSLEHYRKGAYPSFHVCSNDQCRSVIDKQTTWRCGLLDWASGNHRADCTRLSLHRLREPEHLSARARSFMCSLVQSEFHKNRMAIYLGLINYMQRCTEDDREFCVLLDYLQGTARITIKSIQVIIAPPAPEKLEAQLAYRVTRAAKNCNRTLLVVMTVAEVTVVNPRIFLVQFSTPTILHTLRAMAEEIPLGAELTALKVVTPIRYLLNEPAPVVSFGSA
ncbi:hypothetical protein DFH06DRAFT_1485284 [Mycena polygramma]|nr:hypothetical protein DFH06DRAFT_1485284 [Mycena polygramma]